MCARLVTKNRSYGSKCVLKYDCSIAKKNTYFAFSRPIMVYIIAKTEFLVLEKKMASFNLTNLTEFKWEKNSHILTDFLIQLT